MKKFFFFLFGLVVFSLSANAYYLNPSTGAMTKGGSKTISIFATPGTTSDLIVKIRMSLVNATVTAFNPGPSFISSPGTCPPNGTRFTDNTICVDLGKPSPITDGELLGTFTVTWANVNGEASITKTSDSAYWNGNDNTPSLGLAGSYRLGIIPATPFIPDLMPEIYLATGGLVMIFVGIYLFQNLKDEKKNFQKDISY